MSRVVTVSQNGRIRCLPKPTWGVTGLCRRTEVTTNAGWKQGSESVTRTRVHFQTGKVTFKICSRFILEWIFLISSRHSPRRNWDQILKETRVLILNLIQICSRYILINKFKISSRYNLREYGKHIQNISQIFSGIKSERNGEEILNLFFIYH